MNTGPRFEFYEKVRIISTSPEHNCCVLDPSPIYAPALAFIQHHVTLLNEAAVAVFRVAESAGKVAFA